MNHQYKLTAMTAKGGWASKQGPEVLRQILGKLPEQYCDQLLVGFGSSDDAAVYQMNKEHLNTIIVDEKADWLLVKELIEQSYQLTK